MLQYDGIKFKPDLVLVQFTINDLADTYLGIGAVKSDDTGYLVTSDARALGRIGVLLYVHSHVARILL